MKRHVAAAAVALAALAARPAGAWEPGTTHAGLAEQAALGSDLQDHLAGIFGHRAGLFEPLTIPPADAPALFEAVRELDPTHGYAPDARGELRALGWLVAGAVLADTPARHAAHHFFDPASGSGLSESSLDSTGASLSRRLWARVARAELIRSGMPATEWLSHPDNPMNLAGFLDQYGKAVSSRTPAERERHLAGALLAAGAIVHVVQDMASPAHARADLAAHARQIGPERTDVGSRFERIASLAYGRLGVPEPSREIPLRPELTDYITADDKTGLADVTARSYFSGSTMPRSIEVTRKLTPQELGRRLEASARRPSPVPAAPLQLDRAASLEGATLAGDDGVCLARYRHEDRRLSWSMPDACALEQIGKLLPEASAFGAGAVNWLFRGSPELTVDGGAVEVAAGTVGVKTATVTLLWDDGRGVRTKLATAEGASAAAGETLGRFDAPSGRDARAVIALVRGTDEHGQPLVTAARADL